MHSTIVHVRLHSVNLMKGHVVVKVVLFVDGRFSETQLWDLKGKAMRRKLNVKLYSARKEKLWTIREAAKEAHVDSQTYQRWELGKQIPHVSSLRLLCQAFGKMPTDLGF